MEEQLQKEGYAVVIADTTEEPPSPEQYDVVFVGGSIHAHKYHNALKDYVKEYAAILNEQKAAFYSVCLAMASDIPEEHEEAQKIAIDFLDETGWAPSDIHHIAGALRYTKYDYFKKLIMRMIAKKQGGDTDTSQDHEYTDWEAVKKFALEFAA